MNLISPACEELAGEDRPVTKRLCTVLFLRKRAERVYVVRVGLHERRVILNLSRDELPRESALVKRCPPDQVRLSRIDKAALYPRVADSKRRVRSAACADPAPWLDNSSYRAK